MADGTRPHPRISVVVAAWNAAATIETAIGSVIGQEGVDLECLVVDDGSTDGTPEVLASLGPDPRLRVLRSPRNEGVSAARNRALELAWGTWLAFLDADDRLLPGGLAAMLEAADADDARVVVGQRISTDGERTWLPALYDLPDIRVPGRKSLAANPGLLYYAGPAGKLFHRSLVEGLRFEGRRLGDQPWVLRAMVRAGDRVTVIAETVYEWRRPHPDRYVATITSARERSASLGADAVRMAVRAWDLVTAEFAGTLDGGTAASLGVVYAERLLRADLGAQLRAAVRRGDPDLAALLAELAALVAHLPAAVVRSTDAVAREVLEPPARGWIRLDGPARSAYLRLLGVSLAADPEASRRVRRRWIRAALPALARGGRRGAAARGLLWLGSAGVAAGALLREAGRRAARIPVALGRGAGGRISGRPGGRRRAR